MANFKRILAGVMSCVTAVSLAACSNSATNGSGAGESDTTNSSTETTIDDEIENPVSVGDISIDAGEEVEPAELEYLGCYDITTAGDVKPSYKYFSENYGCTIKCTIVGLFRFRKSSQLRFLPANLPTSLTMQTTHSLCLCQRICTLRLKNIWIFQHRSGQDLSST